ncbi:MAG TPA: ABC transporter ATP-binding protein [Candidatus Acidoferrales bacterium]|nr:ABC transporter ATP-binding protein [Candidatus Acidoferrales bacterium]
MIDAPVIQTRALTKSYGRVEAVRSLDLVVAPGCITGFLGRNGAGKSTTIKMLLGMIRPTSGDGAVLGRRITDPRENVELRRHVAYVSEDKRLYAYMTVEQMLRFTASFYPDWRHDIAENLLREYELPRERKVRALSKGMRTKLALLLAFARRPDLLILDEPGDGLDPFGIEQLLQSLVAICAEGTAVFFSSHQIAEVERISDRVAILERGRLILDLSLDDMRESYRQIDVVFPGLPAERDFQIAGIRRIRAAGHQWSVFASGNADAIVDRARDFHASSIQVTPVGLREIFLEMAREN